MLESGSLLLHLLVVRLDWLVLFESMMWDNQRMRVCEMGKSAALRVHEIDEEGQRIQRFVKMFVDRCIECNGWSWATVF